MRSMWPHNDRLQWAPGLTLVLLLGPVLMGLGGTLAPILGWLPGIAGGNSATAPWRDLLAQPGLPTSIRLSITTGVISTVFALALAVLISAAWQGSAAQRSLQRMLPALLAIPHSAAALGLVFLLAPSGWIVRWLSPWATGWEVAPDILIIGDPAGIAMIVALVIKEVPFLLLMTLAADGQADALRSQRVAQSLGYGSVTAWIKVGFPRVYPQICLPVYAVLAYAMTVVDVAMILGPTTPAPLAVNITAWMSDPDLALRTRAATAALLQLLLVLAALAVWRIGEVLVGLVGRRWIEAGARGALDACWRVLGRSAFGLVVGLLGLSLAGQALWSVAGLWVFPDAVPQALSLQAWQRSAKGLEITLFTTLALGSAATVAALALTLACLEAEQRFGTRPAGRSLWLLYMPLLLPQVVFLPGLQILLGSAGVDGNFAAVLLAHLVFVLPYVFLTLAGPYRAWDTRNAMVAATLAASPARIFWCLRLPMLLAPLLTAVAVGFAVSVGQYLPTLLIGGGRVVTLTTEAVALAAGGDRRIIGVHALLQMALPLLAFSVALGLPALLYRQRRGMRTMG